MRQKTVRRTALAVAAALIITALPATAGAAPQQIKRPNKDGSIPAMWDLPTPEIESDDTTPVAAGGNGNGSNSIQFGNFDDGDMLVAFPGSTFTGHAGVWKKSLYTNGIYSWCVWSANKTPVSKVQREQAKKYREYDYCFGIWVPTKYTYGLSVVNWCAAQAGEPYDITSSKSDYSRWYCSKLPWAGWKVKTGLDLDHDGGAWVKPADLVNSSKTSTFAYSD